ncbi:MAG: threonine synthase [Patescibacteria group bacterium]
MKYYSTNRKAPEVDFRTALLEGLAEDGGLYMPQAFPGIRNQELGIGEFEKIISRFTDIPKPTLRKIIKESFNFPVPLVKLDKNLYVLELFHGPTLSFKDFGARFMARTMEYFVTRGHRQGGASKLNIIVATSGDTGSAVASAFYGLKNINVFVLYPSKRVSPLQEKQITTFGHRQGGARKNIFALEVKGDFDDCQRLVKQALGDSALRKKINLSSANSINIGRLLPQMHYYFSAYTQLLNDLMTQLPSFIVPSGNFGNLTAGLLAKKIGLPAGKFIAAVNINSGVPKYLRTGKLPVKKAQMTYSNAMDVGVPSNWARILDLYKNNLTAIKKDLEAITVSEAETEETIKEVYKKYGYIADPHTAVGLAAAFQSKTAGIKIVLATAHPAKFPEIVEKAIGKKIPLPKPLLEVQKKKKNSLLLKNDYREFKKTLSNKGP